MFLCRRQRPCLRQGGLLHSVKDAGPSDVRGISISATIRPCVPTGLQRVRPGDDVRSSPAASRLIFIIVIISFTDSVRGASG